MNSEDRIREAFDDLRSHVGSTVSTDDALDGVVGRRHWTPAPALAAAVVVIVLIGGAAALNLLPGGGDTAPTPITQPDLVIPDTPAVTETTSPAGTGTSLSDPVTTDGSGTTTRPAPDPVSGPTAPLYRVDSDRVAADVGDPFLNVRHDPSPEADIVEKLPPSYASLVPTGGVVELDSGAVWWEVELALAVRSGPMGATRGWVNSAFLVPLDQGSPVTIAEVPACAAPVEGEFHPSGTEADVGGTLTVDLGDGCTRTVVAFVDDAGPASALPGYGMSVSARPLRIDLDTTGSVRVGQGPVYVARSWDGALELVGPGVEQAWITPLEDRGILVIDTRGSAPPSTPLVALVEEPWTASGSVSFRALARPFEANLTVMVETPDGSRVDAVFAGTWAGTIRSNFGPYTTTDWTEAWGAFSAEISGLDPGSYVLVIDPDVETEDTVLRVPIEIEEGASATAPSDTANLIADKLIESAVDRTVLDPVLFAEAVTIGLVEGPTRSVSADGVGDRGAWTFDPDAYRARTGPFDVLGELGRPVRVSEGTIPHCAAPAASVPSGLADLDRVNLEPIGIDSCLDWFSVSAFVDDDGRIAGVLLDLWEP